MFLDHISSTELNYYFTFLDSITLISDHRSWLASTAALHFGESTFKS